MCRRIRFALAVLIFGVGLGIIIAGPAKATKGARTSQPTSAVVRIEGVGRSIFARGAMASMVHLSGGEPAKGIGASLFGPDAKGFISVSPSVAYALRKMKRSSSLQVRARCVIWKGRAVEIKLHAFRTFNTRASLTKFHGSLLKLGDVRATRHWRTKEDKERIAHLGLMPDERAYPVFRLIRPNSDLPPFTLEVRRRGGRFGRDGRFGAVYATFPYTRARAAMDVVFKPDKSLATTPATIKKPLQVAGYPIVVDQPVTELVKLLCTERPKGEHAEITFQHLAKFALKDKQTVISSAAQYCLVGGRPIGVSFFFSMKDNGHKGIRELRRDLFGRMSSPLPQRILGDLRTAGGLPFVVLWAPAQHAWSREHGFGVTFLPAALRTRNPQRDTLPVWIPIYRPPGTVHSCPRCRPPKKGEGGEDNKADKPKNSKLPPPTK